MAEAFSNKVARAVGVVNTATGGAIGITTNLITGISTTGVSLDDLIDNGNYIFKSEEKDQFISQEPSSKEWIKPYLGGKEFINGEIRWILLAQEIPPSSLSKLPLVKERIAAVRNYRLKSPRKSTQKLAETPTLFQVNVIPKNPFLVIPEISSSTREYLPIAWVNAINDSSNIVNE